MDLTQAFGDGVSYFENEKKSKRRIQILNLQNKELNKVMAEVYLEAIIERSIEYVDNTDSPDTAFKDLTSDLNKIYGRKFKVKSTKWLSRNEI